MLARGWEEKSRVRRSSALIKVSAMPMRRRGKTGSGGDGCDAGNGNGKGGDARGLERIRDLSTVTR